VTIQTTVVGSINAYATEGGLDGRFEPATCFNPMIALGHLPAPGAALSLWSTYESLLSAAAEAGLTAVRFDLSWARLEPQEGHFDDATFARYGQAVAWAHDLGLDVHISACDNAWPSWLGLEPWLWPWTFSPTIAYLERLHHALPTVKSTVLFADPDALRRGFLAGDAPPWRTKAHDDLATVERSLSDIEQRARALGFLTDEPAHVTVTPLVEGMGPLRQKSALFTPTPSGWRRAY
jgi:hypothetical protein